MHIDLKIAYIPDDVNIWAFHAGRGKKYLRHFVESSTVFLDYPGLRFHPGLLENDPEIKKHLLMSDAIYTYSRRGGEVEPSIIPDKYVVRNEDNAWLAPHVTNVKRFFREMKKGDIVIVPPRTQYDPLNVGILQAGPEELNTFVIDPFLEHPFFFRPVRWLPVSASKRDVSKALAYKLENPNTIVQISKEQFGNEVFSHVYKNYETDRVSKIDVDCPGYRGKSPLETVQVQELIAFFTAIFYMMENGHQDDLKTASFNDIVYKYYDDSVIYDLTQNFNSPGRYRLIGRRALLASFIATGIGLAGQGVLNKGVLEALAFSNSGDAIRAPGERTEDELREFVQGSLSIMPDAVLEEANKKGLQGSESVGMQADVRLRAEVANDARQ